jgi:hypothetical protein
MPCDDCKFWLCQKVTDYEDGTRIVNHQSAEGRGLCENLGIETDAMFWCAKWDEGRDHVAIAARKSGSPWHHSVWGKCPDCKATPGWVGGGICGRCAGTAKVLHYDDGYIGEEQTRMHPNEKAKGPPPPPMCMGCGRQIEDVWVACPFCGARTNRPEAVTKVADTL